MENATDGPFDAGVRQQDEPPDEYCCAALRYFRDQSTETATVAELQTALYEQTQSEETDLSLEAAQSAEADQMDDEDQIGIYLHHVALPKLADAGLVEYDARSNTARYRGPPTERP